MSIDLEIWPNRQHVRRRHPQLERREAALRTGIREVYSSLNIWFAPGGTANMS
jgi:hypothetical protein